jgi:hypothetical protein
LGQAGGVGVTVGDLLTILGGDPYFVATDTVQSYGKSLILVGRGSTLLAEINIDTNTITKMPGARMDADSCAQGEANVR